MRARRRTAGRARRSALLDDSGSASLEFIVGGVLLLVPIVYLVIALGLIQSATLGVEAAARHTARAIALAADAEDADHRAALVLEDVASEYGLDPAALDLALTCPEAEACPEAGATLRVTVSARIPLPLVPPILGLERVAAVPVEATAVQKASRLWGTGS